MNQLATSIQRPSVSESPAPTAGWGQIGIYWRKTNTTKADYFELSCLNQDWVLLRCSTLPKLSDQLWIQTRLERLTASAKPFGLIMTCAEPAEIGIGNWMEWCKFFTKFDVVYGCAQIIELYFDYVWGGLMVHSTDDNMAEGQLMTTGLINLGEEVLQNLRNIRFEALSLPLTISISDLPWPEDTTPEAFVRPITQSELILLSEVQQQEWYHLQQSTNQLFGNLGADGLWPIVQSILKTSDKAMIILDAETRVLLSNKSATELFRLRYGVVIEHGMIMLDSLPSEQQDKLLMRLRKAHQGESFLVSDTFKRGDSKIFLEYSYSPVFKQGHFAGILLRIQDVTATRINEQERLARERQIRSLTEKIPGVIFQGKADTTDGIAKFIYMSPSSINYLGEHADTITSDPKYLSRYATDINGWNALQANALLGQDLNYEGPFLLPNLGLRWLLFTAQVSFHTTAGYIYDGLIMDVTDRILAREEAKSHQERLDVLTQTAPGVVFEFNLSLDGQFTVPYISQGGYDILGLSQNPDMATTTVDWFGYAENQDSWAKLQESAQNLLPWDHELLIKGPGQDHWMSAHALPHTKADGSTAWYGMMVDVSRLKASEADLVQYAQALNEAQSIARLGSFEYNFGDQRSRNHGHVLQELIGLEGELVDQHNIFTDRIHPEDRKRVAELYDECVATGKEFSLDYRIMTPNDVAIYLFVRARFTLDDLGQLTNIRGTGQDVTNRKQLEETLVKAREEAEMAASAKTQFLSAMSHEIRTPLNAIIGINNLLLQEVEDAKILGRLTTLEFCARNLLNTINKLLDLSKLEAGKYKIAKRPFDLVSLLRNLKDVYQLQASQKGIVFELEQPDQLPASVMGDENILNNVLNNLLGNAIKFTDKGMVCLTVTDLGVKDNIQHLNFSVMDTGQGIPEDMQHVVFEAYEQVPVMLDQKQTGTGLGLPIVKQLLESLGTTITLVSKPNRGSTFSFDLLLERTAPEQQLAEQGKVNNLKINHELAIKTLTGCHILLAEDNEINAMIFKDFLKRWEITYDWACNGDEVVRMASQSCYDMILMDIQMPVLDGIRATKIIRSMSGNWFKQVPIIAFSAFALQETANEALEAGMNDYLLKPFTPEQVMDKCLQYMLPYRKVRQNGGEGVQTESSFYIQPQELPDSLQSMKLSMRDFGVIRSSLREMTSLLEEALLTADGKLMQRICHKFIPSLKMLNVSDVWLDLSISRQVTDAGNLNPELAQRYLSLVNQKVDTYLASIAPVETEPILS